MITFPLKGIVDITVLCSILSLLCKNFHVHHNQLYWAGKPSTELTSCQTHMCSGLSRVKWQPAHSLAVAPWAVTHHLHSSEYLYCPGMRLSRRWGTASLAPPTPIPLLSSPSGRCCFLQVPWPTNSAQDATALQMYASNLVKPCSTPLLPTFHPVPFFPSFHFLTSLSFVH